MHIERSIVLVLESSRTIATVNTSMEVMIILVTSMNIDVVTFVEVAVILWNITVVEEMERVDLIMILIIGGMKVLTGEIHDETPEIVVICWIVMQVMTTITAISMKS